jgi:hypothetical protein
MADAELDTLGTETDEWDIDELLKEYEPEVEEAEKKADDSTAKLTKGMRKLAERQARMEEKQRVEKLTNEFYEKASDGEKELADVLLAGVSDEGRVKKMLDLAKAKAKAMSTDEQEAEESAEEETTEKAFAPAVAPSHVTQKDPWEPVIEAARSGDPHASFLEFMADDDSLALPAGLRRR